MWYRRHPRRAISLALLSLAAAVDLTLGTALRAGWFQRSENLDGDARLRRFDLFYHHGFVRSGNTDSADYRGNRYQLATNSMGLRDRVPRVLQPRRPAGVKFRLALLGDSFTEGLGVTWDSTLVGRTAAAFAADSVEVLNLGVSGSSPVLAERRLLYLMDVDSLELDGLVVELDLTDVYDELKFSGVLPLRAVDTRPRWRVTLGELGAYSLTYSTARAMWHGQRDAAARRAGRSPKPWWRATADSIGLALMERHVESIRDRMTRRGIKFAVAVHPWPGSVADSGEWDWYHQHWLAWAHAHGVPLFDLSPAFVAATQRDGHARAVRRLYLTNDVHWSLAGSGLAADAWRAAWCTTWPTIAPRACVERTRAGRPL